jgi:hypothetical protein
VTKSSRDTRERENPGSHSEAEGLREAIAQPFVVPCVTRAKRVVIASEAKQFISRHQKNGLLRGACHRAGIRPIRWLAMTEAYVWRHASEPQTKGLRDRLAQPLCR